MLEHMRLTQRDILDFCRDPAYEARNGLMIIGEEHHSPTPESWHEECGRLPRRRERWWNSSPTPGSTYMEDSARRRTDVFARVVLVADHSAYHIGELVRCGDYLAYGDNWWLCRGQGGIASDLPNLIWSASLALCKHCGNSLQEDIAAEGLRNVSAEPVSRADSDQARRGP